MKRALGLALAVLLPLGCGADGDDDLVPKLGSVTQYLVSPELIAPNQYQLGDEWGKRPVTAADVMKGSPAFARAVSATAKVGGATGFYLGKFAGAHVMATNHHVYPTSCVGKKVSFPLLGLSFQCVTYYGTWKNVDLSLFEIEVKSPADEQKLAQVAANFQFKKNLSKGQTLVTAGFGVAENPSRTLVANQDSDCRVFSKEGEYKLIADPDEVNPGDYLAWSFANGCDVSHGDSGSAMVDRASGEVMGIIWTGRIPKSARVQSSTYLRTVEETDHADVWAELSYGVPAIKMVEYLREAAATTSSAATRTVLTALLQ